VREGGIGDGRIGEGEMGGRKGREEREVSGGRERKEWKWTRPSSGGNLCPFCAGITATLVIGRN